VSNRAFRYSFVIPTYKRPDVLEQCLEHIAELGYDRDRINVFVIDNGETEHTADVGKAFEHRLNLSYIVNEKNLGPGGSLNKGLELADGDRIIIANDDALIPKEFLQRCDVVFEMDPAIGCIGFRAIEDGYEDDGGPIGVVGPNGNVAGNFSRTTDEPVDVDHVYGFCYAITRTALESAGPFDETLLARPYASGNRIETDHCLEMRRFGYRVVYDGQTGVRHLAKPRLDINERSLRWRLNDIRNTLYLLLKHYGWFGRGALSLRYALLHDLGLRSACFRPTQQNLAYFLTGVRGRLSAAVHWLRYRCSRSRPTTGG